MIRLHALPVIRALLLAAAPPAATVIPWRPVTAAPLSGYRQCGTKRSQWNAAHQT